MDKKCIFMCLIVLIAADETVSLSTSIYPHPVAEGNVGDDLNIIVTINKTEEETWFSIVFMVTAESLQMECFLVFLRKGEECSPRTMCSFEFNSYDFSCNFTHFRLSLFNVSTGLNGIAIRSRLSPDGNIDLFSLPSTIKINVPVDSVILAPAGAYVESLKGKGTTLTCITGDSFPASTIYWFKGDENVTNDSIPTPPQENGNMFITSSKYVYKGTETDHGKQILCIAKNVKDKRVISMPKTIFIGLEPQQITVTPSEDVYTVAENENIGPISCSAVCRPECTFYWKGSNGFRTENNVLRLDSVKSNGSGFYRCHASNKYGNKSSSSIDVFVFCPPAVSCHDGRELFSAGIASLVIGLLADVIAVVFVVFGRIRQNQRNKKSSEYYADLNSKNAIEVSNYDNLKQLPPSGTNREREAAKETNDGTYEECLEDESRNIPAGGSCVDDQRTDPRQTEGFYANMKGT